MDQKRYDDAEKILRQAMEANPTNANIMNALGYMYAERGVKLQEAHDLVSKALDLNPVAPHIQDSMGWVLFRLGKLRRQRSTSSARPVPCRTPKSYAPPGEIYQALGDKAKVSELSKSCSRSNRPRRQRRRLSPAPASGSSKLGEAQAQRSSDAAC